MNTTVRNLILFFIVGFVIALAFNNLGPRVTVDSHIEYSQFIADVKAGRVEEVVFDAETIRGEMSDATTFETYSPETDNAPLIGLLLDHGVEIEARAPENQGVLMQIFISWFPMLLLIAVWIFFMRQMQGGGAGRGAMSFGKSKARLLGEDQVKVT
ncbi:MAG: ATP-dependent metallopeptidase FtsH/Yme1/Tma family protein, partial [Pseudomonadota bacterium]|nr:ATP-dependent metallopeptidase FtsH/Yme1/Tma family protein [Pseudomonadota bacterium]